MGDISIPFNGINGLSKTDSDCSREDFTDLMKCKNMGDENSYQSFFEKENFEKYTENYPKATVEMKVLCRVPIPD